MELKIDPFEEVLAEYRAGKMVILADDADRENEGDLILATECVTPEAVSFMMHQARGLICVSIGSEAAERLALPLQVVNNQSPYNTPFTVSVDLRASGVSGVTAQARAAAMLRLSSPEARAEEFVSPGHVFPLIAHAAGVTGRQGQTEGSYDLSRIVGFQPTGVLCEILNKDGSMARGNDLNIFAAHHKLKVTTVAEIIKYRVRKEVLVRKTVEAVLPTDYGDFTSVVFEDDVEGKEHLALLYGDVGAMQSGEPALVRIHSECLTGDVFGSRRCDCGPQLAMAMEALVKAGRGVLLYLRQEGRGIGLMNKLRAYALQDQGADTVEANVQLGFEPDARDYAVAANILNSFNIRSVRLLTNNPRKMNTLQRLGIHVAERVPVITAADEMSKFYLDTKREKLGHLI